MFLAYSEIFGRAAGLKKTLQSWFIILARSEPSKLRLAALATLAEFEKSTVSNVLKKLKANRSGGTYLSVAAFFENLEKEGILEKHEVGRWTYWQFSPNTSDLKRYLLISDPEKWLLKK